jgi:putative ABC transport system permease protein
VDDPTSSEREVTRRKPPGDLESVRFYELLLHLYPRSFRVEYGDEIVQAFSERLRQAPGAFAVLALWVEMPFDLLGNAIAVHWDLLRQDLQYSLRSHARAPGLALTAILVTALGIGANTAVFSVTDQVLIRPLPFRDSERLVKLWERMPGYTLMELSPPNYRDWKQMSSSFEATAAYYERSANLVGVSDPLRLDGVATETELFRILGVQPILGRTLTEDDDREGAPGTVLLSYGLWQSVFGGSPNVLGTRVRLDDRAHTIVGVMPRDFFFPDRESQFWTPTRFTNNGDEDRNNNYLEAVAKLRPGVSIDEARAEMELVTTELEGAYPKENEKTRATVIFLRDEISVQARLLLAALFGASICVLLIACANLAHLLLARGMERRKELTVRSALGAGRERLVRQLLTESMALAVLGGLAGLGLAAAALPLLSGLTPGSLPLARETTLDPRVLAFAVVVITVTGIGFGVLPALQSAGGLASQGLHEGARSGVGGKRERLRSALVVGEVAASVVLLICSGLLVRALLRIQAVDPGFRTRDVLAIHTPLPGEGYESTGRRLALYDRVLSEVRSVPGVTHASYISFLPMVMTGGIWPVTLPGLPEEVSRTNQSASLRYVSPDFFSTLGIPLRKGRDVRESDTLETPFIAVVSESFARRYWPEQEPLGQRFQFGLAERTVVGVVADIRVRGLERTSEPQVYLPYGQVPDGTLVFYAPGELVLGLERPEAGREAIVASVRKIVHEADPELPVSEVRTLEEVVERQTAPRLVQLRILGVFAALSLLLSAVGIYGLLSFAVSRRRAEIGLRMAFGASRSDILAMILAKGLLLALSGGAVGLTLGYAAARAIEALLAGVEPSDTLTYAIAAGVALAMTLIGSLVPALRAVRVDPVTTIRAE